MLCYTLSQAHIWKSRTRETSCARLGCLPLCRLYNFDAHCPSSAVGAFKDIVRTGGRSDNASFFLNGPKRDGARQAKSATARLLITAIHFSWSLLNG
jgi:hypothetical protein